MAASASGLHSPSDAAAADSGEGEVVAVSMQREAAAAPPVPEDALVEQSSLQASGAADKREASGERGKPAKNGDKDDVVVKWTVEEHVEDPHGQRSADASANKIDIPSRGIPAILAGAGISKRKGTAPVDEVPPPKRDAASFVLGTSGGEEKGSSPQVRNDVEAALHSLTDILSVQMQQIKACHENALGLLAKAQEDLKLTERAATLIERAQNRLRNNHSMSKSPALAEVVEPTSLDMPISNAKIRSEHHNTHEIKPKPQKRGDRKLETPRLAQLQATSSTSTMPRVTFHVDALLSMRPEHFSSTHGNVSEEPIEIAVYEKPAVPRGVHGKHPAARLKDDAHQNSLSVPVEPTGSADVHGNIPAAKLKDEAPHNSLSVPVKPAGKFSSHALVKEAVENAMLFTPVLQELRGAALAPAAMPESMSQLTSSGSKCKNDGTLHSACGQHAGLSYTWCYTPTSWDFCVAKGETTMGYNCSQPCHRDASSPFAWCKVGDGVWDFCSKELLRPAASLP
eukprot:TRINITY_DN67043_c0_g1_i1.p1 TRINITY_DN67043_c0_g1~~TRINITY_DN67043_c0_g1_i1.p1  ORF type:complete len:552 (-),score=93.38 TRINITY_DN67043_c0_g1_i1:63-1598(-)